MDPGEQSSNDPNTTEKDDTDSINATNNPINSQNEPPRSRFTYSHLRQLRDLAVDGPLRVVAHIDLDAFYAQCEMVRTGTPEDQPLAVAQWANLIAINYPARRAGLNSRHVSAVEAKKLCPNLKVVHVATWKPGDTHWRYRPDEENQITSAKACLDPYRHASKRILEIFKRYCDTVEKASVDESFLDLGKEIVGIIKEKWDIDVEKGKGELPWPNWKGSWEGLGVVVGGETTKEKEQKSDEEANVEEPKMEIEEPSKAETAESGLEGSTKIDAGPKLEKPAVETRSSSETLKDSSGTAITATEDCDWDDVVIALAAELVTRIRKEVHVKLGYTCAAGIAQNKMLSKLGSGENKPNNQTIIRPRSVGSFLSKFQFTKIRNLGGKLGHKISEKYDTKDIGALLAIPISSFRIHLANETAEWLYNTIRGIDYSAVSSRTRIKSMLSAKSFRPPLNSATQARGWLSVFAADLNGRLSEEGADKGAKRRPKSMHLHVTRFGNTARKSTPLPGWGELTREVLMELAEGMWSDMAKARGKEGMMPVTGVSISITGFEESEVGTRGIESFFGKKAPVEAEEMDDGFAEADGELKENSPDAPRPTSITPPGLPSNNTTPTVPAPKSEPQPFHPAKRQKLDPPPISRFFRNTPPPQPESSENDEALIPCDRCSARLHPDRIDEHADYHFAIDLQKEERAQEMQTSRANSAPASTSSKPRGRPKAGGRGRGTQTTLRF